MLNGNTCTAIWSRKNKGKKLSRDQRIEKLLRTTEGHSPREKASGVYVACRVALYAFSNHQYAQWTIHKHQTWLPTNAILTISHNRILFLLFITKQKVLSSYPPLVVKVLQVVKRDTIMEKIKKYMSYIYLVGSHSLVWPVHWQTAVIFFFNFNSEMYSLCLGFCGVCEALPVRVWHWCDVTEGLSLAERHIVSDLAMLLKTNLLWQLKNTKTLNPLTCKAV